MYCVLCLMSRLSIQEIKARHASMVQMLCYVDTVDTKCIHMFLPVTSLIFNEFSIRKKFWNAENQCFPTIPSNFIYVDTVNTSRNISM